MSRTRPCPIPLAELRQRYVVQRQSLAQLARELEANERTVARWLREAGARLRDRTQANQISGFHRRALWP